MDNSCVLITNGNLFSMIALGDWIRRHGRQILKVYVTQKLPSSKGNVRGVLSLLYNSGWSYTYFKIWANRLFPKRLRGRHLPGSVEDYLRLCGLDAPVTPVNTANDETVVAAIREASPDYLLSFSATHRFRDPLIASPTKAAINVHYGALPAYAGLSPYFWHLHNREARFGVTLHRIVPELDAGPIIEQVTESTEGTRTCLELLLRMTSCVSPMLERFFQGTTTLQDANPQDPAGKSYFRHPTRGQMREFRANGLRMMDRRSREMTVGEIVKLDETAREKCQAGE